MELNVLLIVDDWEALEVYEGALESFFSEVRGAPFGSEGVRMARERRPDRILVDLTFEDMHASEACAALRAEPELRDVPIVVVLNRGEAEFVLPGVFPGVAGDAFVRRPYETARLVELLRG